MAEKVTGLPIADFLCRKARAPTNGQPCQAEEEKSHPLTTASDHCPSLASKTKGWLPANEPDRHRIPVSGHHCRILACGLKELARATASFPHLCKNGLRLLSLRPQEVSKAQGSRFRRFAPNGFAISVQIRKVWSRDPKKHVGGEDRTFIAYFRSGLEVAIG